jgi:hypothetical protein
LELKQCKASTVVLRLVVDNKYCQQRKRHTQNTTNLAQMIAAVQAPWRFPVVNASVITGFVRIANTESAEIPLSSSGSEYNGARWFVESLQPDAGAMQWVAWNGSEDWLQYAQRCKLEADTKGLVRGRHQLGYKVLPDKVENSDAKCGRYSSQQLGPKVDSRWHCDQQRDRRKLPISQLGSSPQRHSSTIKQRLQRQLRAFLAAVLKKDRDR